MTQIKWKGLGKRGSGEPCPHALSHGEGFVRRAADVQKMTQGKVLDITPIPAEVTRPHGPFIQPQACCHVPVLSLWTPSHGSGSGET